MEEIIYQLLEALSDSEIEVLVKKRLSENWELTGSPFLANVEGKIRFYQTVVNKNCAYSYGRITEYKTLNAAAAGTLNELVNIKLGSEWQLYGSPGAIREQSGVRFYQTVVMVRERETRFRF